MFCLFYDRFDKSRTFSQISCNNEDFHHASCSVWNNFSYDVAKVAMFSPERVNRKHVCLDGYLNCLSSNYFNEFYV